MTSNPIPALIQHCIFFLFFFSGAQAHHIAAAADPGEKPDQCV
jgi:hypothetical protein